VREKNLAQYPHVADYQVRAATGWADLARVLAIRGKADEAQETLRRLSASEPESAEACNNLAWALAACPAPEFRDPARALKLAQHAVETAPDFPSHWRTLGLAQIRTGDPRAAIASLMQAIERRQGGDGRDWALLALAYVQAGSLDEARQWHVRAASWRTRHTPDDPELRQFENEAAELLTRDAGR
jgi:Flp pilus assembly protein TadD